MYDKKLPEKDGFNLIMRILLLSSDNLVLNPCNLLRKMEQNTSRFL